MGEKNKEPQDSGKTIDTANGSPSARENDGDRNPAPDRYQDITSEISGFTHEINNHLTTVLGNAELILMANPDLDPLVKRKLNTILTESRSIAEIVKKLRTMIKT